MYCKQQEVEHIYIRRTKIKYKDMYMVQMSYLKTDNGTNFINHHSSYN